MRPTYALNLSPDGIGLWHRTARSWHLVGDAALDDPELGQRLEFLRRTAAELEAGGITSKLIIPNSQILYRTIEVTGKSAAAKSAAVIEAMEGATPYALDQLAIDWKSLEDGRVTLAAVSRQTLAEAEAFAADHRFNAVSFEAMPEEGSDFPGIAFFGETQGAAALLGKGQRVERDDVRLPAARNTAEEPEEDTGGQVEEGGTPLVLTGTPENDPAPVAPVAKETQPVLEPEPVVVEPTTAQGNEAAQEEPADPVEDEPEEPDAVWEEEAVAAATAMPPPARDGAAAPVAARRLAGITDVGLSHRAQIALGLTLIAVALILWLMVFMRETQIVENPDQTPPEVMLADGEVDGGGAMDLPTQAPPLPGPTAGMTPVPVDPLRGTNAAIAASELRSPLAIGDRIAAVESGASQTLDDIPGHEAAVAQTALQTLDDTKAAQVARALRASGGPDRVAAELLERLRTGRSVVTANADQNLDWLEVLKPSATVEATKPSESIGIAPAQPLIEVGMGSDTSMPRLLHRELAPAISGVSGQAGTARRVTVAATRIVGTEIEGPRVRRGLIVPDADNAGEGAKRVASLPPRHDVPLAMPVPRFEDVALAMEWSGVTPANAPDVTAFETAPPGSATSPALVLAALGSDAFPALDQSVPLPPGGDRPHMSEPPGLGTIEVSALKPPLKPGSFMVVSALLPPLASPEIRAIAGIEEEIPAEVIAQAIETAIAEVGDEDPAADPGEAMALAQAVEDDGEDAALALADEVPGVATAPQANPEDAGEAMALADAAPEAADSEALAALVTEDAGPNDEAVVAAVEEALSAPEASPQPVAPTVTALLAPLRPPEPEVPAAEISPEGTIVVSALMPRTRPGDVGNRSAATNARASSVSIPSSTNVAARATQDNALSIGRVTLIGVFGKASDRKALVRLSNGRIRRVAPGDRLDGGQVVSISATSLLYSKNGKTQTLEMPRG